MSQPKSSGKQEANDSAGGSSTLGSQGRVAKIHSQTRQGLFIGISFALIGLMVGSFDFGSGWWLSLHLFLVGGLLSIISAVTQMLAVTWSTSPAPSSRVAQLQRFSLAFGSILFAVGREQRQNVIFLIGGVVVILSLILLAGILLWIRKHAVTDRFAPAIEAYVFAILAGTIGMSFGLIVGIDRAGELTAQLRNTHLVLNLFGLVGIVIAATLPYFAATQVRSKMSARATPTAKRVTLFVLGVATSAIAIGEIVDRPHFISAGFFLYAFGLLLVILILPMSSKNAPRWIEPRALQLLFGMAWWMTITFTFGLAGVKWGQDKAVLQALVVGGFGQILVGSLAYLGPVLRGGGHEMLSSGFAITRSWVALAAGNLTAIAAVMGYDQWFTLALTVWAIDVVVRALLLVFKKKRIENVAK